VLSSAGSRAAKRLTAPQSPKWLPSESATPSSEVRAFSGLREAEMIDAWVPLFLFAVLFGLSMDYQVFLLSRIRERYIELEGGMLRSGKGAGELAVRSGSREAVRRH
jgi:uncharacterized membrane protein YdfJ with MMPL/SSD domain